MLGVAMIGDPLRLMKLFRRAIPPLGGHHLVYSSTI